MTSLAWLMVPLAMIGVVRVCVVLVAADLYDLSLCRSRPLPYAPTVWVVIPAYNEELCVARAVQSVLDSDYGDVSVVVVDDGSVDGTVAALRHFGSRVHVVSQENTGKAAAINAGMHLVGDGLVMVLDADSTLSRTAVSKMVAHFADPMVLAAAANVKIADQRGVLGWVQRLEYAVVHRLKQGYTVFNCEYVIGGVGSMFRTSVVRACGYFDTDTMTEDIDFSMKILSVRGNFDWRIIFAADAIAYTQAVPSLKGLLRQRFRWKFGRLQAFYKHRSLFFGRSCTRLLSWVHLPYTAAGEVLVLFEPVFIYVVVTATFQTGWFTGILLLCAVYTGVALFTIIGDISEPWRAKAPLLALAPLAYPLLMVIVFVDFVAVLRSLFTVLRGYRPVGRWEHVERTLTSVPG
ncbi:glycosyltransferase family 2 protein [Lentzea sp. NBC_00516]|uniref:glycosyltransferase n=1 Tax=Lentzea sp. NBC_00516 TaxID=2903582 RepID=UPI002E7FFE48|nr:glycosyltransferase family 2 protein [Lentzea sp. NBC_00516]WUD24467.1 glycosyltransferase family 2 protein [Lentzea sp. NBC_00516]